MNIFYADLHVLPMVSPRSSRNDSVIFLFDLSPDTSSFMIVDAGMYLRLVLISQLTNLFLETDHCP